MELVQISNQMEMLVLDHAIVKTRHVLFIVFWPLHFKLDVAKAEELLAKADDEMR